MSVQELSAPTAVVKRDGEWKTLEVRELVPGDVIELKGGDVIPGDAVVGPYLSSYRNICCPLCTSRGTFSDLALEAKRLFFCKHSQDSVQGPAVNMHWLVDIAEAELCTAVTPPAELWLIVRHLFWQAAGYVLATASDGACAICSCKAPLSRSRSMSRPSLGNHCRSPRASAARYSPPLSALWPSKAWPAHDTQWPLYLQGNS